MGPLGNIPDGWHFLDSPRPLHTMDHDFTVTPWGDKWRVVDPSGATIANRTFATAGAACRAANELGIEAGV